MDAQMKNALCHTELALYTLCVSQIFFYSEGRFSTSLENSQS